VPRSEVEAYRRDFNVLSTRYTEANAVVHVLGNENPGAGFEPVSGELQDVYFAMTAEADKAGA
jgi:ABC-2 type transport system ATP-binding protein